MLYKKIFLVALNILFLFKINAQTSCCQDSVCGKKADTYAGKISSLVTYLGKCNPASVPDFKKKNDALLAEFQSNFPQAYNEFKATIKIISAEFIDDNSGQDRQLCFFDALPIRTAQNTMAWVNYVRDVKPVFPSTEFCGGFKKRFEIGQGADAFLDKGEMAYMGAAKFYVIYQFSEKNKCGGRFRLMAGPGFFLRDTKVHLTLNSRASVRIGDLKGGVFSFGNFNFYGGFNSNFNQFNYVESGFEVELGWLGFNLSGLYDTYGKNFGFLTGIVLANTKFKKK